MAKRVRSDEPVEVANLDDLRRVAREVDARREPLTIAIDGAGLVVVSPVTRRTKRRTREERATADDEAFLSAAGGWKGLIDGEEFKKQITAARGSHRPPVTLRLPEE